jgi:hypothetical protein
VAGDEKRVRTTFLTYEADDGAAETLAIVLGAVVENFRGVTVLEMQDDTLFADALDRREALHELVTSRERLTDAQRETLEEFAAQLSAWDGSESP